MQNYQIFQGLKVLELAGVLAGPAVGQFFAELGADVVKVESPRGGDVTRSWIGSEEKNKHTISAYFASVNWGKRSIIADLRNEVTRNTIQILASKADIIIAAFRPGEAIKLGLDYESLKISNKRLIYGSITGYPQGSVRAGYDAVIQAESGFMHLNREPGAPPQKMPVALVDLLAAHQLKESLLLALIQRSNTGLGSQVAVSLMESALASLANQATNFFYTGKEPQPMGSAHPNITPYGTVYRTRDNREILLAVGNDRQFKDLCLILDLTLYQNDRYKSNPQRVLHRQSLEAILKDAILQQDSKTLIKKLEISGVPAGLVSMVGEALQYPDHAAVLHKNLFATGLRQTVFQFNQDRGRSLSPPPELGENTVGVLVDWLDYDPRIAEDWKEKQG